MKTHGPRKPAMNKQASSGSLTPRTYPTGTITIRCSRCDRTGRYTKTRLAQRFGADTPLPDILNAITEDCSTNGSFSMDRCKAVYGELAREC